MSNKKEIKVEVKTKEAQQPQKRGFGCFLALHKWNGGNVCVNCGKRR